MLNLAVIEETVGRFEAARTLYDQVLRECDEVGAFGLKGMACANVAGVLAELGDGAAARAAAAESLRMALTGADRRTEAFARRGARMAAGTRGLAHDVLEQGRAAARALAECGYPEMAWIESARVARTLSELGDGAAAREQAESVLAEVAAAPGGWGEACDAPFDLHCVFAALGDPRAPGLLEVARRGLEVLA